jgi:hypothetical protein
MEMSRLSFVENIQSAISAKMIAAASNTGMIGGSLVSFVAWVGEQDIAAGVGVLVALGGFFVHVWHKRALIKIERAKLSPEQRKAYDQM